MLRAEKRVALTLLWAFGPSACELSSEPEATLRVGEVLRFDAPTAGPVIGVAVAPDQSAVVAAGWGDRVVRFELATGEGRSIHTLQPGDVLEPGAVAWAADRIAVGAFNGTLLFDGAGGVVAELVGRSFDVGFSQDGTTLYRLDLDAVDAFAALDGAPIARVEVSGAQALVVGRDAVYVGRAVDAFTSEVLTLDPRTLAVRTRTETFGAQIEGDADGLAVLSLSSVAIGAEPGSLVALDTEGLEDLQWLDPQSTRPLVVAAGFSAGVHLFRAADGRRLDTAALAVGEGLDVVGDLVAVGAPDGVALLQVVPRDAE